MDDGFGLPVTTSSEECVQAINAYYEAVLAYSPFTAWEAAEAAVAKDPQCPLACVLAADYAFCRGDAARATALLKETSDRKSGDGACPWTWREAQYLDAWKQWCLEGNPGGCYEVLLGVVQKHPSDLYAVKRGQIMGLILGDGNRILAIVEAAVQAGNTLTDAPPRYLHGMWAFGLEQAGRFADAESKAREGFALEQRLGPDAWLDHGLAHALYFQGEERLDEAIEFLASRGQHWSATKLHPFLYTHNWWHLALLHCEKRDVESAVQVFDEKLWAEENAGMRSDPQVQLNALGLLWRLETRGEADLARPRWAQVICACQGLTLPPAANTGDGVAVAPLQHSDLLLDVLLVRALCIGAKSDPGPLERFLTAVEAHGEKMGSGGGAGAARGEAYRAIARSVAEIYRTDQPEATMPARQQKARQALKDLKAEWGTIGGSEEQRLILLEAVEGPVVCGSPEVNYDKLFF